MTYTVKEIFRTIQGEGAHLGRVAVFVRFSGCNLWTGREEDRASARCRFCDTDFVGGTRYDSATALVDAVEAEAEAGLARWVVLTGGEPALQIDKMLLVELRIRGFHIAVETNGTLPLLYGFDWICVSPKVPAASLQQRWGDELKLVFPQAHLDPAQFTGLRFVRLSLSPMAGPNLAENTKAAIEYCLANPSWNLTMQAHKTWGIR